jgi:hypothetical protein
MTLNTKHKVIAVACGVFVLSLLLVQYMEITRKRIEAGLSVPHIAVPKSSQTCVDCHAPLNPGIVEQWKGSTHALKGVGCYDCHQAEKGDVDAFEHQGHLIATVVTPRDCSRCHLEESKEFAVSHHSKAGNILASLDNFLAETVEGSRVPFNPHSQTPGFSVTNVNGMASSASGCQQCHGSEVSLKSITGERISHRQLKPGPDGKPTELSVVAQIARGQDGKPI